MPLGCHFEVDGLPLVGCHELVGRNHAESTLARRNTPEGHNRVSASEEFLDDWADSFGEPSRLGLWASSRKLGDNSPECDPVGGWRGVDAGHGVRRRTPSGGLAVCDSDVGGIAKNRNSIDGEHDVGRTHVEVDKAGRVQSIEGVAHTRGHRETFGAGQRTARLETLGERGATKQWEYRRRSSFSDVYRFADWQKVGVHRKCLK